MCGMASAIAQDTMASRSERNNRPGRESLSKRLGKVARQIRVRDCNCCRYCGATAEMVGAPLQLDHLLAQSEGGQDIASNIVLACPRCNRAKSNKSFDAWVVFAAANLNLTIDAVAIFAHAAQPLPSL